MFNLEGKKPIYCSQCPFYIKNKDKMIDVKSKQCKCGTRPSFNFEGKKAEYCKNCKTEGMVDVKSKRCEWGKAHPT